MVCAIIGAVCSVTFSVIVPIVKKVIEAKRDGHIDTDEALGILDEVSKGCEKVKTELDKQNKDD